MRIHPSRPLILAVIVGLCGCTQDIISRYEQAPPPDSAPNAADTEPSPPAPRAAVPAQTRLPTHAAESNLPRETEQEASAQCWMEFESRRHTPNLDARATLVDRCIAEKMRAQAR